MEISNKSYWLESIKKEKFNDWNGDLQCEAVVIGGGIAGVTTAYRLQRKGIKTVLIDKGEIGGNTTGHTTAKITSQHNLIYDYLIENFGKEQAKQYIQGNQKAINFIDKVVKENNIDCDLEEKTAYIYTDKSAMLEDFNKEAKAYKDLGINAKLIEKSLPVEGKYALEWPNQRQFHPIKYLYALANKFIELGGQIYEKTTAKDIQSDSKVLITDRGKIRGDYFIITTHYPFYDKGHLYFAKMAPYTNYIGFFDLNDMKISDFNMYLSDEIVLHSYRLYNNYMLVGGCNHKTGQLNPLIDPKENIIEDGMTSFGLRNPLYIWGAEDYITIDKVPYIGRLNNKSENIFVATGFGKWGMTTGTLSALIIEQLINLGQTEYTLFDPSRHTSTKAVSTLISENSNIAKEFIKGKLDYVKELEDLEPGKGGVFTIRHKKVGVYKDLDGKMYGVSVVCPHMKATLEWNETAKTWDCPIHGSRFNFKGEVIDGPANNAHSLKIIPIGETRKNE